MVSPFSNGILVCTYVRMCVIFQKQVNTIPPNATLLSLHVIFNPVDKFGYARVHARIAGFAALVAERDNADLRPLMTSVDFQHQRSTRITLTRVLAALLVTGAQKCLADRLKVSLVAFLVGPHRHDHLSLNGALFPTCFILYQIIVTIYYD